MGEFGTEDCVYLMILKNERGTECKINNYFQEVRPFKMLLNGFII